jgi:hypothetical protein
MGLKDVVNKVFEDPTLWPPPEDVGDLTACSEHAVRALKHAREELPPCDDIELADKRQRYFATRLWALDQRRLQATTRAEADGLLPIMGLIDLCFNDWTRHFEYLKRQALQRGHGRNYAFARAEHDRRFRGLYPSTGGGSGEAA